MVAVGQTLVRAKARVRLAVTGSRRFPVVPVAIISTMVLVAIFAAPLAPYSPYETSLPDKLKPPFWVSGGSTEHLLGTDLVGRDVLSRMIYGARVSLLVAAVGVLLAGAVGTAVALVAGYLGGRVDALIMRIVDIMLAFPVIILALILAVVLGPSLANLIYIICIILWVRYARVLRGDVLQYKQREFVTYARVAGTSTLKIMTHHLLPNIANTLMVLLTFEAGAVILLEAGLSFLGVGVPPPTPTWGRMIAEGRDYIVSAWWLVTLPGVAISLVVLSLNLFGDWLRDYIDPKLRQM